MFHTFLSFAYQSLCPAEFTHDSLANIYALLMSQPPIQQLEQESTGSTIFGSLFEHLTVPWEVCTALEIRGIWRSSRGHGSWSRGSLQCVALWHSFKLSFSPWTAKDTELHHSKGFRSSSLTCEHSTYVLFKQFLCLIGKSRILTSTANSEYGTLLYPQHVTISPTVLWKCNAEGFSIQRDLLEVSDEYFEDAKARPQGDGNIAPGNRLDHDRPMDLR